MIDDEFMNNAAAVQSFVLKLDKHFTSGTSSATKRATEDAVGLIADGFARMADQLATTSLPESDVRYMTVGAWRLWDDIRMRWVRNPDYRPTVRGVYGRHAMAPNYPYFDGRLK